MRTPYSVLLAIAALLSSGLAGPALAQSSTSGCDYLHGEFLNKINIGAIGNLQHGNDNGNAVFVETVNGQWVGLDNAHNLDEPEGRAFAKMMLLAHVNYLRLSTVRVAPENTPCLGANTVKVRSHFVD